MDRVKRKDPAPLQSVLADLFRSLGIEKKIVQHQIIRDWPELVGEKIARVSKAERVDGSILYVRVVSDAWRNELVLMKNKILSKIHRGYGPRSIQDVRFI